MYYGVATYEEGRTVREVRTAFLDSIEAVVREIAKMCRNGRIATCEIMLKINGKIFRIKEVVL